MSSILDLSSISRRSLLGGLGATAALVLLHPFFRLGRLAIRPIFG